MADVEGDHDIKREMMSGTDNNFLPEPKKLTGQAADDADLVQQDAANVALPNDDGDNIKVEASDSEQEQDVPVASEGEAAAAPGVQARAGLGASSLADLANEDAVENEVGGQAVHAFLDTARPLSERVALFEAWHGAIMRRTEDWKAGGKPSCNQCGSTHPPPCQTAEGLRSQRDAIKAGRRLRGELRARQPVPTPQRASAPAPAEAASARPSGRAKSNVDEMALIDFIADLPVQDPAVRRIASGLIARLAQKRAAEESPDEGGSSKKKKRRRKKKPGNSCQDPKGPHKDPKDPPSGPRGPGGMGFSRVAT
ncbi:hypothetical protein IQ07DRAFT_646466 [Pyrenochaeta sp. DS3sAY3a]|nr:hypothetical protein IQ07DRAFT_646466 [Pyrenochaeta sp. DS3sAY3a]